eukprot:GHUV01006556.1.p1 GENE.GHUV01006556.1~~GHUV01006556.1.p1  ORF type:complete len:267 (+),score=85.63 GHUV01006556.1:297-1097(+)
MRLSRRNTLLCGDREFETIIFDLDDTLYHSPEIPQTVRQNIQDYIINNMNMPLELAQQLVQELYYKYGTTMAGLAATGHNLDFDHWHDHVHGTLDYDRLLHKQPAHHKVLENLNVQRHVFTNADAKHAANCLTRMGLTDCFQSIWCFENLMEVARSKGLLTPDNPIMCKPQKTSFENVLEQIGANPQSTIFVDDSLRNVAAAHELGIFTVLVSPTVAAEQQHQHIPGVDLVIGNFLQLPEVLPQIFTQQEQREEVPAGLPVSVLAS